MGSVTAAVAFAAGLTGFFALPSSASNVQLAIAHSTPTAKTLLSEMKSAIAHVTAVQVKIGAVQSSSKQTESITLTAGVNTGLQHTTSGGETADVILTKNNVYLHGNSSGLTAFFALPSDDLALVGNKWISIKSNSTQYKTFATSMTAKSILSHLVPATANFTVTPSITVNNKLTYDISWTTTSSGNTVTETLTLPRTGKMLPLGEQATSGTTTETSTLSKWNQSFKVKTPSNTIAITKLHQS